MELAAAGEVRLLAAAFARHCHGSATQRVAAYLLDRHVATNDLIISNRHQSAAASLGLRRATVTLALHELEALRAIEARRGSIEILDAAVLEEAALNLPPGRPALR
jgi:DNA-binding transcriptional MocR family regulator